MRDGLESLGRVRAQGALLLALAFLTGGLAGSAVERVLVARRLAHAPLPLGAPGDVLLPAPLPAGGAVLLGPDRIPPVIEELRLTADQRARIARIFERSQARTDSIMRQALPRIDALMDSVRAAVRAVLTDAQRARLDTLERRLAWPPPAGVGPPAAPWIAPAFVPRPDTPGGR